MFTIGFYRNIKQTPTSTDHIANQPVVLFFSFIYYLKIIFESRIVNNITTSGILVFKSWFYEKIVCCLYSTVPA